VSLLTHPPCRIPSGAVQLARVPLFLNIPNLFDEQRRFTPADGFKAQAHVHDTTPYARARQDPEGYWADWARQLEWSRPWDRVLEWKPPSWGARTT